jgi:hypothetical protein
MEACEDFVNKPIDARGRYALQTGWSPRTGELPLWAPCRRSGLTEAATRKALWRLGPTDYIPSATKQQSDQMDRALTGSSPASAGLLLATNIRTACTAATGFLCHANGMAGLLDVHNSAFMA